MQNRSGSFVEKYIRTIELTKLCYLILKIPYKIDNFLVSRFSDKIVIEIEPAIISFWMSNVGLIVSGLSVSSHMIYKTQ